MHCANDESTPAAFQYAHVKTLDGRTWPISCSNYDEDGGGIDSALNNINSNQSNNITNNTNNFEQNGNSYHGPRLPYSTVTRGSWVRYFLYQMENSIRERLRRNCLTDDFNLVRYMPPTLLQFADATEPGKPGHHPLGGRGRLVLENDADHFIATTVYHAVFKRREEYEEIAKGLWWRFYAGRVQGNYSGGAPVTSLNNNPASSPRFKGGDKNYDPNQNNFQYEIHDSLKSETQGGLSLESITWTLRSLAILECCEFLWQEVGKNGVLLGCVGAFGSSENEADDDDEVHIDDIFDDVPSSIGKSLAGSASVGNLLSAGNSAGNLLSPDGSSGPILPSILPHLANENPNFIRTVVASPWIKRLEFQDLPPAKSRELVEALEDRVSDPTIWTQWCGCHKGATQRSRNPSDASSGNPNDSSSSNSSGNQISGGLNGGLLQPDLAASTNPFRTEYGGNTSTFADRSAFSPSISGAPVPVVTLSLARCIFDPETLKRFLASEVSALQNLVNGNAAVCCLQTLLDEGLQVLDLSGCGLDSETTMMLIEVLESQSTGRPRKLRRLNLSANRIGTSGVVGLGWMLAWGGRIGGGVSGGRGSSSGGASSGALGVPIIPGALPIGGRTLPTAMSGSSGVSGTTAGAGWFGTSNTGTNITLGPALTASNNSALPWLVTLDLSWNNFGPDAGIPLAKAIEEIYVNGGNTLRTLNLSNNGLGDRGIMAIANGLSKIANKIRERASGTGIEDDVEDDVEEEDGIDGFGGAGVPDLFGNMKNMQMAAEVYRNMMGGGSGGVEMPGGGVSAAPPPLPGGDSAVSMGGMTPNGGSSSSFGGGFGGAGHGKGAGGLMGNSRSSSSSSSSHPNNPAPGGGARGFGRGRGRGLTIQIPTKANPSAGARPAPNAAMSAVSSATSSTSFNTNSTSADVSSSLTCLNLRSNMVERTGAELLVDTLERCVTADGKNLNDIDFNLAIAVNKPVSNSNSGGDMNNGFMTGGLGCGTTGGLGSGFGSGGLNSSGSGGLFGNVPPLPTNDSTTSMGDATDGMENDGPFNDNLQQVDGGDANNDQNINPYWKLHVDINLPWHPLQKRVDRVNQIAARNRVRSP